jgi:hypothetical protein
MKNRAPEVEPAPAKVGFAVVNRTYRAPIAWFDESSLEVYSKAHFQNHAAPRK